MNVTKALIEQVFFPLLIYRLFGEQFLFYIHFVQNMFGEFLGMIALQCEKKH